MKNKAQPLALRSLHTCEDSNLRTREKEIHEGIWATGCLNHLNHQNPALFFPLFLPWGNLKQPFCTVSFSPVETLLSWGEGCGAWRAWRESVLGSHVRCRLTSPYHILPAPISCMEKNELNVPSQIISCVSNDMFLVKRRKEEMASSVYFIKTWAQF